jgi:NAD(P)-dependent dehydrogenase (short-subunit alcohol dehydrogenase family)
MTTIVIEGTEALAGSLRHVLADAGIDVLDLLDGDDPGARLETALGGRRLDGLFIGSPSLPAGDVIEIGVDAFDEGFARGVHAAFELLASALPLLTLTKGVAVIELGSGALNANKRAAASGAVDTARLGLLRTAALEYARDGVRVNGLLVSTLTAREEEVSRLPRRSMLSADEAARAAAQLFMPDFAALNGAVVVVDQAVSVVAVLPIEVDDAR